MGSEKSTIKCFSCRYCYTCRYYQNSLWDWYILNYSDDGCPAEKYPFDSLRQEIIRMKREGKEIRFRKRWP